MNWSQRERMFLACGALALLVLGTGEWFVRPLWERRQTLRAQVEKGKRDLLAIQALTLRYRQESARLGELERRLARPGDGFSLFAFLEDAANRTGIRDRIVVMNPLESVSGNGYVRLEMSLQFDGLTMAQVIGYLEQLERAPRLLRVRELSLEQAGRNPGELRVHAVVVAYGVPGLQKEKS